jgi:hypothetical protein
MRVEAQDLARTLFALYLAHDRTISNELRDEIASVEIISSNESEVVAALVELHDLIADERRRRH